MLLLWSSLSLSTTMSMSLKMSRPKRGRKCLSSTWRNTREWTSIYLSHRRWVVHRTDPVASVIIESSGLTGDTVSLLKTPLHEWEAYDDNTALSCVLIVYKLDYIKVLYCHVLLFLSQRSITDEINRESRTDILTIAISYGFMFLYIAIFLGHFRSCASIFVSNSVRER